MDLQIRSEKVSISSTRNTVFVILELENVDTAYFDNEEVAECISIKTYFRSIGIDKIKQYIEDNYDWFK